MSVSVTGTEVKFNDNSTQLTAARTGVDTNTISSDYQLTSSSKYLQIITATISNLSVILPDATTLAKSDSYFNIQNNGPTPFSVKTFDGQLVIELKPFSSINLSLKQNSTQGYDWGVGYSINDLEVSSIQGKVVSFIALTSTLFVFTYVTADSGPVRSVAVSYVNGTATWGTYIEHTATNTWGYNNVSAERVSDTSFVVLYGTTSSWAASVRACTVSGTTITQGTAVAINPSNYYYYYSKIYVINSGLILLGLTNDFDTVGSYNEQFRLCSISGTTITAGTLVTTGRPSSNHRFGGAIPLGSGTSNFLISWHPYAPGTYEYRSYSVSGTTPTVVSSGTYTGGLFSTNFVVQSSGSVTLYGITFNYSGATITSKTEFTRLDYSMNTTLTTTVLAYSTQAAMLNSDGSLFWTSAFASNYGPTAIPKTIYIGNYSISNPYYTVTKYAVTLPENYYFENSANVRDKMVLARISDTQVVCAVQKTGSYFAQGSGVTDYLAFVSIKKIA